MSPDRKIIEDALSVIPGIESALRSIGHVYNEHEDVLAGSGMKYDMTNIWIFLDYIKALKEIQSECK